MSDDKVRDTEQCSCCYAVNSLQTTYRKRVAGANLSTQFSVAPGLFVFFIPTSSRSLLYERNTLLPPPPRVHNHYSSRFSTELSVSEPWKSSAQILVPSSGWGESCRLSRLWHECLVSISSPLASLLFCILDAPLPPETEVCPRLWLLSALCWGHRWLGGHWGYLLVEYSSESQATLFHRWEV